MNRNAAYKYCCNDSENQSQLQPTNTNGLKKLFGPYPDEPFSTAFDKLLNYFGIKCDGGYPCEGVTTRCKSICEPRGICSNEQKKCSRFSIRNCGNKNQFACEPVQPCYAREKCPKNDVISLYRSNTSVNSVCSQSYTKLFEVLGPPPEIVCTEWALTRIHLFSDSSKTYEVIDDESNAVKDVLQNVKTCKTKTFFAVLPDGSTAIYDNVSNPSNPALC